MKIPAIHKLFLKCKSVSTDTRKIKKNDLFFALKGKSFNGNMFTSQAIDKGAKYVIVDEEEFNCFPQTILVNNVLETLQQLASYHRSFLNLPIIALTGSNGKTTTKELINTVLTKKYNTTATQGNLNNHIGVPLTLLSMSSDTEIGVVEMGANHLNEIEFLCSIAKPDYGYITNFGKAHLEGFGSLEGVIEGKSEMYKYLIENNKTIFVNAEDSIQVEKTKKATTITFGNSTKNDTIVSFIEALPFVKASYNNLKIKSHLLGDYNFNNIAAAIAIGNYFKVKFDSIKLAIENYVPSNNRSQIIEKDTTKIILDAYNANPSSMRAALQNFNTIKGDKIVILGDMFELGKETQKEHQEIVNLALKLDINQVILIGENFSAIKPASSKLKVFNSFDNAKKQISNSDFSNTSLLIKGSRGMALERILDLI